MTTILLPSRQTPQDIYPYRRVWRTTLFEAIILLLLTGATLLAMRLLKQPPGVTTRHVFSLVFALIPLGLWVLISYRGEQAAVEPRERLLVILLLSGLAANAIGVPLVDRLFNTNQWLATAPGTSRILGFVLTIGLTQEFIKYAVVRYSVWPTSFRIRSDGIAFAITAAIGYATVLNINYILNNDADPAAVALRIAETTFSQVAVSTIMGYFLSEMKFSETSSFGLPIGMVLAALLNGLIGVIRGGLVVGNITATGTANNAAQGLGVSIVLLLFLSAVFNFLINNADERAALRNRPEFTR